MRKKRLPIEASQRRQLPPWCGEEAAQVTDEDEFATASALFESARSTARSRDEEDEDEGAVARAVSSAVLAGEAGVATGGAGPAENAKKAIRKRNAAIAPTIIALREAAIAFAACCSFGFLCSRL